MEAGVGNGPAWSAVSFESYCEIEAAAGEFAVSGSDGAPLCAFGYGNRAFMRMCGQHGDLPSGALGIAHHRMKRFERLNDLIIAVAP